MAAGRLGKVPWGTREVVAGLLLGVVAYAVPRLMIGPSAQLFDAGTEFRDVGDIFEKAGVVARYADAALASASTGASIPGVPRVLGDPVAARLAWVWAVVSAAAFAAVAVAASRARLAGFARATGLRDFSFDRLWLPAMGVAALFIAVSLYSTAAEASGIDFLIPAPANEGATLRDNTALAFLGVATVLAGPVAEELFFRGLVFSGLARWGFLPAAALSGLIFGASHLDPGTVIPFTGVGMVLAWTYWRSGSLWDAIAFHMLFNALSFTLLVARQ